MNLKGITPERHKEKYYLETISDRTKQKDPSAAQILEQLERDVKSNALEIW